VAIDTINTPIAVVAFFDIETLIAKLAPTGKATVNTIFCLHATIKVIAVLAAASFKTQIAILAIINIIAIRTVFGVV